MVNCKRGHPLSGDNLYISPKGSSFCKACKLARKNGTIEKLPVSKRSLDTCLRGHSRDSENIYVNPKTGYITCKICRELQHKTYRDTEKGKAAAKTRDLRLNFWTLEQFEFALKIQNNACAICKTSFEEKFPNNPFSDHDHMTNTSRGLLCSSCNTGLGMFKDSPALLEYATKYLRKYGK